MSSLLVAPPSNEFVWKPIPNSSQALALNARANVILYTGTRGPGKTDTQLMRFRARVGQGYGDAWRGIIFDREYKNLDDIVLKAKRWFPRFKDGARFYASKGDYKWVWKTGEELLLRTIEKEEDYWDYHGHEYPFIGWNELTKYPDPGVFNMMFSCNRTGWKPPANSNLPPIPLEVFATTNPYGPGHGWVKRQFIDVAEYGKVVRTKVTVDVPGGKPGEKREVERTQVAIFGNWRENPYLDEQYIAGLMGEKNQARKKAWLTGDWNIVAGGALDDVWEPSVHVVPRFHVPKGWRIDRAFDWGSTHPFYVGWFAESDGTEATIFHDGRVFTFCPPRGSIILCAEWYGVDRDQHNKGLQMSSPDIAKGILLREKYLLESSWIPSVPSAGPADNQIFNNMQSDELSIADKMALVGVSWERSNKSPGTRVNGLQLVRDRLAAAVRWARYGEPERALFFMDHCRDVVSILPMLPRDPKNMDDVDTDAEDHPYDVVRYRILHSEKSLTQPLTVSFV